MRQTQAQIAFEEGTNEFRAEFWEGDATKHYSVKKKGFSVKRGEAIQ